MGVHGLWRLIEPSGKPVPLETLENKILAVDVSIWLHQAIKGFQDAKGASVPNAHLLGIYHRLCKLLYFQVKPVFVFDGGVPILKKQTIAKRSQLKEKNSSEADRLRRNLLTSLLKHSALNKVLSEKAKVALNEISPPKRSRDDDEDSLYHLPASQLDSTQSSSYSDEDDDSSQEGSPNKYDLHSIDTSSAQFQALPVDVRHEILTDLKETRKQSSWGRLHELPTQSNDFSTYQMSRLLKRQSVQSALEEAQKEMGGHSLSLGDLERLMKDQGVLTSMNLVGNRIASDENTRFLLIKDITKAIEEAKAKENKDLAVKEAEVEPGGDLEKAIALSLQDEPAQEQFGRKKMAEMSFLHDFSAADFQELYSSEEEDAPIDLGKFSSAHSYMLEYSRLTPTEITRILAGSQQRNNKGSAIKEREVAPCENENNAKCNNSIIINEKPFLEDKQEENLIERTQTENVNEDVVEIMSESSDDEFVEVEGNEAQNKLEVRIQPLKELNEEDDLFKDVFESETCTKVTEVKQKEVESANSDNSKSESIEIIEENATLEVETHQNISIIEKTPVSNIEIVARNEFRAPQTPKLITVEEMSKMKDDLEQESNQIQKERSAKERMATNITDQMYQEAQELLELFGVPYVIAPMEAEAQCAFFDLIGLTDGTITDDSDIWLFGGQTVYKNFFDQRKHVLEYKSESIDRHFKLSREQMILLAMLVGSDYTTGLRGVGPVTALEILACFPPKAQLISGLLEFKSWLRKGKATGPKSRGRLRNKLKNVDLTENFPNPMIVQAYLEPHVETSREEFAWGKPDIAGLIHYAGQKFGWTRKKSEEILDPVVKRLADKSTQKKINDFFKLKNKVRLNEDEISAKMSKRVQKAVQGIKDGGVESEDDDDVIENAKQKKGKRKLVDEDLEVLKKTKAQSKKKVAEIEENVKTALSEASGSNSQPKPNILHKKEVIPQKQRDKSEMLRNKMRAIETFRKSKNGPGHTKKRKNTTKMPKINASYLSEDSSD